MTRQTCSRYRKQFDARQLAFDLERFEERAALMHFDGGLAHEAAEYRAALVQWVEQGQQPGQMKYEGL